MTMIMMMMMMQLWSVALTVTVTMSVCPTDKDLHHRWRSNCSSAALTHIPTGLEPTTTVLLLSSNLFSSLSWSSFSGFPLLHELDLTQNQVAEVVSSHAPILPTLSVLRLGFNQVSSLQDAAFFACPALTELHLPHNHISFLSDHALAGLRLLQILDLTANQITVLPPLLLRPLVALETLYLENNEIQVLPADWFMQLEEVSYLYLSANPWSCSCHLVYLHQYLSNHDDYVYVRDGITISCDAHSVVCSSPPPLGGVALLQLQVSDLCPPTHHIPGDFDVFDAKETISSDPLTPPPSHGPPSGTPPPPLSRPVTPPVPPVWTPPPPLSRPVTPPVPPVWTPPRPTVQAWPEWPTPPREGRGGAWLCCWMLIGCLCVCVATLTAILASSVCLMQTIHRSKVIRAPPSAVRHPPPLYRSVLFVQCEGAGPGYYGLTLRGAVTSALKVQGQRSHDQ